LHNLVSRILRQELVRQVRDKKQACAEQRNKDQVELEQ